LKPCLTHHVTRQTKFASATFPSTQPQPC